MTTTEVDDIVANMKRAAMDAEYWRRLRAMIPAGLLTESAPMFTRAVTTSSMNLAAMAAARQGYDAGRWGTSTDCPYPMGQDPRQTFLRRSWLLGYVAGTNVDPKPAPRTLEHQRVTITA